MYMLLIGKSLTGFKRKSVRLLALKMQYPTLKNLVGSLHSLTQIFDSWILHKST